MDGIRVDDEQDGAEVYCGNVHGDDVHGDDAHDGSAHDGDAHNGDGHDERSHDDDDVRSGGILPFVSAKDSLNTQKGVLRNERAKCPQVENA